MSGILWMISWLQSHWRKPAVFETSGSRSGVGGGGAGGTSAPPNILICKKFGQNLN